MAFQAHSDSLVASVGVNRTALRCLFSGGEALASLDVSYTAATSLRPRRRCRLLDELLRWTVGSPCTMDVQPLHHLL